MGKQESLNLEQFIESLDGIKREDEYEFEEDSSVLTTACKITTSEFLKQRKLFQIDEIFNVRTPYNVTGVNNKKISFVGMEDTEFVKFTHTTSGLFICIFKVKETGDQFYVKQEWLQPLFGDNGKKFSDWMAQCNILNNAKRKFDTVKKEEYFEQKYTDSKYGAW